MTDDPFERLARAWLAQGPETAPAWPVEAALIQIDSTPQAGRPPFTGRVNPMSMPARIAAALVVAVTAVAAMYLLGSPSGDRPTPTPTASLTDSPSTPPSSTRPDPTPPTVEVPVRLDGRFWSAVHGFSVNYPREWDVKRAQRPWGTGTAVLSPGSTAFDALGTATVRFSGASQPLPDGWTAARWLDWYASNYTQFQASCVPFEAPQPTVFVGGLEARVNFDGCPLPGLVYNGAPVFDIYFVAEGRGYNLVLEGAVNRAYLDRIMSSVVIRPATGPLPVDMPALDATFVSPSYGLSVRYPAAWTVTAASEPWGAAETPLGLDSPKLDRIAGATARITVASKPAPAGWTDAQFGDWFKSFAPECVGFEGEPRPTIEVNGRTWWLYYDGCPLGNALVLGGVVFGAATVVDGRGYDVALDGAVDRASFEAVLATIVFE